MSDAPPIDPPVEPAPEPPADPTPEPEPEIVDEGDVCPVCGRKGRAEGHH